MATGPLELRHPIVLVHGLGARGAYGPIEYFHGIPRWLREQGNREFVTNLTAWQTIENRAIELQTQIDAEFPGETVNLLGHSMGGLVCRYFAAKPEHVGRVASVTTMGTPNLGSPLADLAMGVLPDSTFHMADFLLKITGSSAQGFRQMGTAYMREEFPKIAPLVPDVAYFSATSVIEQPAFLNSLPIFWMTHQMVLRSEGENDGFVSEVSAKFGEHICTVKGDHYAQIGQFLGFSRGLNHFAFFGEVLKRLKKEGF